MIFLNAAPSEFAPREILPKTYHQTKLSRSPNNMKYVKHTLF